MREVGRGRDELENSLEKSQVLRGVEGGNEDRRPVCMYFAKRILKVSLVYLLAGNKRDIMDYNWEMSRDTHGIRL